MRKDLLLKLADDVEKNLPDENFDMGDYVQHNDCGTVVCLLGRACMTPEFNKMGLRLYNETLPEYRRAGGVNYGAHAGKEFFGMTWEDAQGLFYGDFWDCRPSEVTKEMAVAKIRELCAREGGVMATTVSDKKALDLQGVSHAFWAMFDDHPTGHPEFTRGLEGALAGLRTEDLDHLRFLFEIVSFHNKSGSLGCVK